ncbi:hypothetical protein Tco_0886880 [Tanacetum coccineum]
MQAIKVNKRTLRSRPHAGGSSEGTCIPPGVPDESTDTFKTLCEGTVIKLGVPDEVQAKANDILDWGSENESGYSKEEVEVEWLYSDDMEEKKDDDDDDQSIDNEDNNDDERTTSDEEYDEYGAHDDEYVHDDVDEEMRNVDVAETGKDDEMIDAVKADVEKTKEEEKGDDEPAGIEVANAD